MNRKTLIRIMYLIAFLGVVCLALIFIVDSAWVAVGCSTCFMISGVLALIVDFKDKKNGGTEW